MNCWQSLQKSFFFHYYKLNLYFSNFSLFYYLLVYKPNIELLPCVESFLSISYTNKISFLFSKFNFKIFLCSFVIVSLVFWSLMSMIFVQHFVCLVLVWSLQVLYIHILLDLVAQCLLFRPELHFNVCLV